MEMVDVESCLFRMTRFLAKEAHDLFDYGGPQLSQQTTTRSATIQQQQQEGGDSLPRLHVRSISPPNRPQ